MDDALFPMFVNNSDNETSSDSDISDNIAGAAVDGENAGGDRNRDTCPSVSYDTSLPDQHSYLGTDLEELSGRTVLDDNSYQTIPILTLPGVVLLPGQTLPLQLYHPATVSMMLHIIENDRTFGMINSRFSGRTFGNVLDPVGTTAEIRSYRDEGEENVPLSTLRIIAEGRQRFRLLETRRQHDGMITGKVHILPEIYLGDPGACAKATSMDRFRIPNPKELSDASNLAKPYVTLQSKKPDKYNFANYTWFPAFVYKQYDPVILMNRIKSKLHGWNDSLRKNYMPSEAREFSYWIAANMPLDDTQRLHLLSANDVIERLRIELQILEQRFELQCRDCHSHIAESKDIFSMSLKGPQGTFVNANGYVHETITLYHVKGLVSIGRSSTEQSWFPGYAWTIVECDRCHSHMGWKFTSVGKKSQPHKFWALCRSSISADIPKVYEILTALRAP